MLQLIVYKTRLDLSFLPESNESDLGPNMEDIFDDLPRQSKKGPEFKSYNNLDIMSKLPSAGNVA